MIAPVTIPVTQAGGGPANTDANGNFSSPVLVHPANWSVVRLVGQTSGASAFWTVFGDLSGGFPLEFGPGNNVAPGPMLLAPGQRVLIQIASALPSASVVAQLVGVMSPRLEEVLPFYVPSPNTLTVNMTAAISPRTNIFAIGGGGPVTQTIPIPSSFQACLVDVLRSTATATVTVSGHQSGFIYLSASPAGAATSYAVLISDGLDTSLDVVVNPAGAGISTNVDISFDSLGVVAQIAQGSTVLIGGQPISDDVTDRLLRQLGRTVLVTPGNFNIIIDDQGAGNVNLGVSQLNARPAPWQAPNQAPLGIGSVIAAAGVLSLVAAVGGQTVRIFSCSLAVDAVLATGTINLEDTGNTIRHQFSTSTSPANPFLSEAGGAALPVGLGVQLRNPAASAQTVRGSLVYSQN